MLQYRDNDSRFKNTVSIPVELYENCLTSRGEIYSGKAITMENFDLFVKVEMKKKMVDPKEPCEYCRPEVFADSDMVDPEKYIEGGYANEDTEEIVVKVVRLESFLEKFLFSPSNVYPKFTKQLEECLTQARGGYVALQKLFLCVDQPSIPPDAVKAVPQFLEVYEDNSAAQLKSIAELIRVDENATTSGTVHASEKESESLKPAAVGGAGAIGEELATAKQKKPKKVRNPDQPKRKYTRKSDVSQEKPPQPLTLAEKVAIAQGGSQTPQGEMGTLKPPPSTERRLVCKPLNYEPLDKSESEAEDAQESEKPKAEVSQKPENSRVLLRQNFVEDLKKGDEKNNWLSAWIGYTNREMEIPIDLLKAQCHANLGKIRSQLEMDHEIFENLLELLVQTLRTQSVLTILSLLSMNPSLKNADESHDGFMNRCLKTLMHKESGRLYLLS